MWMDRIHNVPFPPSVQDILNNRGECCFKRKKNSTNLASRIHHSLLVLGMEAPEVDRSTIHCRVAVDLGCRVVVPVLFLGVIQNARSGSRPSDAALHRMPTFRHWLDCNGLDWLNLDDICRECMPYKNLIPNPCCERRKKQGPDAVRRLNLECRAYSSTTNAAAASPNCQQFHVYPVVRLLYNHSARMGPRHSL
jgi:hypothetical protein